MNLETNINHDSRLFIDHVNIKADKIKNIEDFDNLIKTLTELRNDLEPKILKRSATYKAEHQEWVEKKRLQELAKLNGRPNS